jgi:hypothetical protein
MVAAAALVACVLVGGGAVVQSDLAVSGWAGYAGTPAAGTSGLTMRAHRAAGLVSVATAKAEAYWGGTRCQDIEVTYRRLDDRRIAEAEWRTSELDPRVYISCSITFDTSAISFSHFCATVVHEYGHLAGFHEERGPDGGLHSTNKRKVMYPVISDGNVPKTCRAGGAPSK